MKTTPRKKVTGSLYQSYLFFIVLFLCFLPFSYSAITDGIIRYWSLDGNSLNQTGNANLTGVNRVFGTGFVNQGVYMPSVDAGGAQNATAISSIAGDNVRAFNIWAYDGRTGTADVYYIDMGETGTTKAFFRFYCNNGVLKMLMYSTDDFFPKANGSNINCPKNSWVMYTVTYDQSNIRFFINGSLVNVTAKSSLNTENTNIGLGSYKINTAGQNPTNITDEIGIWGRNLSESEVSQLFVNYKNNITPYTPQSNTIITFVSQVPPDITASDITTPNPLNITYNVLFGNLTNAILYNRIISNISTCIIFVNGTCILQNATYLLESPSSFTSNASNFNASYTFGDEDVYPATYNINQSLMESTIHTTLSMSASTNIFSLHINNISNRTKFNIFQIYVNNTGNNPGIMTIYYCNSSYSTGSLPNSNCVVINTIASPLNYSDIENSSFYVTFPVTGNAGNISNVVITSSSSIVLTTTTNPSSSWQLYGLPIISYPTQTQLSTNSGTTYAPQTFTSDMHWHQFSNQSAFCYYLNDTSTSSPETCDNIDVTPVPPSGLTFIHPNSSEVYSGISSINYTSATSASNGTILDYNISLCDINGKINASIHDNQLNLSYNFNSVLFPDGNYTICVNVTDNQGLSTLFFSPIVAIDNTPPFLQFIYPLSDNSTVAGSNQPFQFNIICSDPHLYAYSIEVYNPSQLLVYNNSQSGLSPPSVNIVDIFTPVSNGVYKVAITCSDSHTKKYWKGTDDVYNDGTTLKFSNWEENSTDAYEVHNIISYTGQYTIKNLTVNKTKDRYTWAYYFDYKDNQNLKKSHEFTITCPGLKIINDEYPGHVLCEHDSIWIDLNTNSLINYSTKRCGKECYKFSLILNNDSVVQFQSIGGINIIQQNVTFTITNQSVANDAILLQNTCPSTLPGQIMLFGSLIVMIVLAVIGFVFAGILSIFAGLGIIAISFVIIACFNALGLILSIIGLLIFVLSFTRKLW